VASDTSFLNSLLLACSRGATRLFRNSNGVGWVGKSWRCPKDGATVTLAAGDVVVRKARVLHAGLIAGSGDLIGWHTITITPDMVGDRVALFVSAEAKEGKGKLEADQRNWRDQVNAAGGIAIEVRSIDDLRRALLRE
jgi:hypothetical protein